jgi:hypothetical protein
LSSIIHIFIKILGGISPNVPAVYEVGGDIKGLCEAKTVAANLPE